MKYSITILQAEIKRLKSGIKDILKYIKHSENVIKAANSGSLEIKHAKGYIKEYRREITQFEKHLPELKADIKKL